MYQFIQKSNFQSVDTVKICKKDLCIEAKGENGKLLANAAAAIMVVLAISLLAKAFK